MIDTLSSAVLAWLLTYLIHSTALLLLAWGLTRARIWSPGATARDDGRRPPERRRRHARVPPTGTRCAAALRNLG